MPLISRLAASTRFGKLPESSNTRTMNNTSASYLEYPNKFDLDVENNFSQSSQYCYTTIAAIIVFLIAVYVRLIINNDLKDTPVFLRCINSFKELLTLWAGAFLIFFLASVLLRMFIFFTEMSLNAADNDPGRIVKSSWLFNVYTWCSLAISLAILLVAVHSSQIQYYPWVVDPICVVLTLVGVIFYSLLIKLYDPVSNLMSEANSLTSGADYGIGMAYSYYYGYLQIIIPSDGALNPGLISRMKDYEAQENCIIPVKKLFILIPESGYIPPDLAEASNDWLEKTKNLESVILNRGGVKNRVYHSTVYKIHPGGDSQPHEKIYLAVEGATPIMTLYELAQRSHPETEAFRKNYHNLIANFYQTLKKLLDSPQMRDTCVLVCYQDYDKNGKKVNLGKVLLERIQREALM